MMSQRTQNFRYGGVIFHDGRNNDEGRRLVFIMAEKSR